METTPVDTGNPHVRERRTLNQYVLVEPNLGELIGQSIRFRLEKITDWLMDGIADVRGDTPNEFRTVDVYDTLDLDFPKGVLVREKYFPKLEEITQKIYEKIIKDETGFDRDKVTLRFISVIHVVGMLLHPYRDVNNQRFRLTALSYLRELSDSYKHVFFPMKISGDPRTQIGERKVGETVLKTERFRDEKKDQNIPRNGRVAASMLEEITFTIGGEAYWSSVLSHPEQHTEIWAWFKKNNGVISKASNPQELVKQLKDVQEPFISFKNLSNQEKLEEYLNFLLLSEIGTKLIIDWVLYKDSWDVIESLETTPEFYEITIYALNDMETKFQTRIETPLQHYMFMIKILVSNFVKKLKSSSRGGTPISPRTSTV